MLYILFIASLLMFQLSTYLIGGEIVSVFASSVVDRAPITSNERL
jgi:hypothetical protein